MLSVRNLTKGRRAVVAACLPRHKGTKIGGVKPPLQNQLRGDEHASNGKIPTEPE